MKIYFAIAAVVIAVILFIVINYSIESSTNYTCDGEYTYSDNKYTKEGILYFNIKKYRFFVEFWSESQGVLWVEDENFFTKYYSNIAFSSIGWSVWEDGLAGQFSNISNKIIINVGQGVFEGTCAENQAGSV